MRLTIARFVATAIVAGWRRLTQAPEADAARRVGRCAGGFGPRPGTFHSVSPVPQSMPIMGAPS